MIKAKKHIICLVVALFSALAFAGGGGSDSDIVEERETKIIVEKGLLLAAFMREKANSQPYLAAMISEKNSSLRKKISKIGSGNVSNPTAVYKLHENLSYAASSMIMAQGFALKEIPPKITFDIARSLREGIPQSYTMKKAGSLGVEAVSMLRTARTFDSPVVVGDNLYIFTFEEAYPVAVITMEDEGNAVWAEAVFVLDRDIVASLRSSGVDVERIL